MCLAFRGCLLYNAPALIRVAVNFQGIHIVQARGATIWRGAFFAASLGVHPVQVQQSYYRDERTAYLGFACCGWLLSTDGRSAPALRRPAYGLAATRLSLQSVHENGFLWLFLFYSTFRFR